MDNPGPTNGKSPDLTIKVGALPYELKFKEDMDPYRAYFGICHHDDLQIWILARLAPLKRVEVLVHEITHAILHVYAGMNSDEDTCTNEQATNAMGMGWTQALRDNPDLVTYIMSGGEECQDG